MNRKIDYYITYEHEGKTILSFLKEQGYTHNVLVQLKKTPNGICINETWAYVRDTLHAGNQLTILLVEPDFISQIVPSEIPLSIAYEDDDIIVIDKPYQMPVHPSLNHYENTLANAVIYYANKKKETYPFRCMNRLDRDTTGLTIVAKNMLSAGILSIQVKERSLHRTYQAICEGYVPDFGTIDAPIARKEASTIERCIDYEKGEQAITHYKRIGYDPIKNLSLVSLSLETGRTHQIRVHMKHIGHPLIGDFLYNPDFTYVNRQALHSASLTFSHPVTKKEMHLASPLPEDLKRISSFI